MNTQPCAITGDRPTGPLHLGHYVGSLKARVLMQQTHCLTVLVADTQALTDNAGNPQKIARYIPEVMKDYLAVGLDPKRTRFVLQSSVPELYELSMLLLNLVSVAQLERNPTVKSEIAQRNFQRDVPAGFLCYPASQAADIIGLGSGVVPVGEDQVPMIQLTNMLIDRLNARGATLSRCEALLSSTPRLPGVMGGAKMSKSGGNAIALGASFDELKTAVFSMYTDPDHLKVSDPGKIEGNVVFSYLDAFDPKVEEVSELKLHYQRGGLGDMPLKRRLLEVMDAELAPIRQKRAELEGQEESMLDLLREGTLKAHEQARVQMQQVKDALGVVSLF